MEDCLLLCAVHWIGVGILMCILWRGEHNEGDDGAGEYTATKKLRFCKWPRCRVTWDGCADPTTHWEAIQTIKSHTNTRTHTKHTWWQCHAQKHEEIKDGKMRVRFGWAAELSCWAELRPMLYERTRSATDISKKSTRNTKYQCIIIIYGWMDVGCVLVAAPWLRTSLRAKRIHSQRISIRIREWKIARISYTQMLEGSCINRILLYFSSSVICLSLLLYDHEQYKKRNAWIMLGLLTGGPKRLIHSNPYESMKRMFFYRS